MKYKKIIAYAMSLAMIFPIANGIINIPTVENSIVVSADDSISTAEVVANTLMNNQSVWNELLTLSDGIKGATFLDVDFDGELELVVSNQQGTIRDTYTEIYKIDTVNNKVIEVTDNSSDYIVDGSHYSMDILQYDVELYTATTDVGEMYTQGDTFYLCTDCLYDSASYIELATIKLTGDSTGTFQKPLFNTITENGVSKHYQCVFNSPNDTWLEDDGDEASEYIGLKNLNLTYSIVAKDGKVTANDLVNSYNAFSYDGFSGNSQEQDVVDTSNKCGDNAYWSFDETTGTLTISGTGAMYDYNNLYGGEGGTDPFAPWFEQINDIKKVIIKNGITYISSGFLGCENLTEVTIPNSVTHIGYMAFRGCTSLKSVTIPKSVTTIEEHAFGFAGEDNIIEGFTIYGYAGSEAENYTNIANNNPWATNDAKITFIALDDTDSNKCGDNAYWSFDETTSTLTISGTGTTYDYDFLTSPFSGLIGIDENQKLTSPVKKIVIEEGITSIGDYLFYISTINELEALYSVTSISLPESLVNIGDYAFAGFTDNLKTLTIGGNEKNTTLKEIGDYAFLKLRDINTVNSLNIGIVPKSVTSIGKCAIGYIGVDGGECLLEDGFTIKGYTGTEAETYAKENGIKFVALDNDIIRTLNENDIITLTGTVKSEDYEINEMNKGTAIILELDTPITYAFYGDTNGVYTDGQEVLVKSVQLSGIDNSYIGKKVKVTGSVMFGHTAHHLRDIVLLDCTVSLIDNPTTTITTTDPGKTVTTTTTDPGKSSPPTSDSGVGKLILAGTLIGATAIATSKKKK